MFKQCLAGILVGAMIVLFGFGGYPMLFVPSGESETATVQVESTRLTEREMAEIVAGKSGLWAAIGGTLLIGGIIVAGLSGVGLVGATVAYAAGIATAGEVIVAGSAFLGGLGAATAGSTICDSVGC